jgi:hypothetical protein
MYRLCITPPKKMLLWLFWLLWLPDFTSGITVTSSLQVQASTSVMQLQKIKTYESEVAECSYKIPSEYMQWIST